MPPRTLANRIDFASDIRQSLLSSRSFGNEAGGFAIGRHDGEIARLIARHACGVTVTIGDGAALAKAVGAIVCDLEGCRAMGAQARAACEAHYNKTGAIEAWRVLLGEVARSL